MITLRRILCPVDFSAVSHRALEHAVPLARWYGAEIRLLHVLPYLDFAMAPLVGYAAAVDPALHQSLQRDLAQRLRALVEPLAPGIAVDVIVVEGPTAAGIVAMAGECAADMIVMGTHGERRLEAWILGSVTDRVLRTAPCPVLTVPRADETTPAPVFKRILCPLDYSDVSLRALEYALSLAQEADARIVLMHAVDGFAEPYPGSDLTFDATGYRGALEARARERLRAALPTGAEAWCDPEIRVSSGKPSDEILRTARDERADVIVLGLHGKGRVRRLFGSTAFAVVQEAHCPVLAVR
jgi:nucleotide-binding universal stress UspA family protein